jgi:hypothetical protein
VPEPGAFGGIVVPHAMTSTIAGTEDALVSAALAGEPDVWRRLTRDVERTSFLETATAHRCRPLLAWQLRRRGELSAWPSSVRDALVSAERAEAALEVFRRQELASLLRAFASAGIPVLLLKGAALAYSLYPEPWLRPREDTDVLVDPADSATAASVLTTMGYRAAVMQSGELVTHQRLYVKTDVHGIRHDVDLHWKVANPAPFAGLLSPPALFAAADSRSIDGVPIRCPRAVDALLLACWHRASHHYDSTNLLWLYDLHLLADGLPADTGNEVIDAARRTGTGQICARGLRLAVERFNTRLPPSLLASLDAAADSTSTAVYMAPGARKVDLLVADLRSLPGWGARTRLVREHLFPPADYMLGSYPGASRVMLPALYLWRIARGARGWFRPLAGRTGAKDS